MRELKFKAPVYSGLYKGDPHQDPEPIFICWVTFDLNSIGITNTDGESVFDLNGKDEWDLSSVDLNKSRQYTGLKDKNGVEIYEGDIVKPAWMNPDLIVIEYGLQQFADGNYSDQCMGWNVPLRDNQRATTACPCEIVGNIHENPELLRA